MLAIVQFTISPLADTVVSSITTVTVDPAYIPAISMSAVPGFTIAPGESTTVTAIAAGAGPAPSYQWYLNGVLLSGETNVSYTSASFVDHDSLSCLVTGTGACHIVSFNSVIIHVVTGITSVVSAGSITLFPNPNNGSFTIRGTLGKGHAGVTIEVRNVLGQVVYHTATELHNGIIDIQLKLNNDLAKGVYTVTLRSGAEQTVLHFVSE